jgi:hypothetical protein
MPQPTWFQRSRSRYNSSPPHFFAPGSNPSVPRRPSSVPGRSSNEPEPPGSQPGRLSKKPGGADTFPDARDTFPGRHPGNPGAREYILGVGKVIPPRGCVPEASGSSSSGWGSLFSRWGGNREPRARKSGIRAAKARAGFASQGVLHGDRAFVAHSTILGLGPRWNRRLRRAVGLIRRDRAINSTWTIRALA